VQHHAHLNFLRLESRLEQIVIDLHDAARLSLDPGVSVQLRLIAGEINEQVQALRRLLVSEADSEWGDL
jgi:hypothetical protein